MDEHGDPRRTSEVNSHGFANYRSVRIHWNKSLRLSAMKATIQSLLILTFLVKACCLVGCGGEEKAVTPKQMEEQRQQDMKRAKAFQREG